MFKADVILLALVTWSEHPTPDSDGLKYIMHEAAAHQQSSSTKYYRSLEGILHDPRTDNHPYTA